MDRNNKFLLDLRTATDAAHTALEALPLSTAITSPEIPLEAYTEYLKRMNALHSTVENHTYPILKTLMPDIEKRRKVEWVRNDLSKLGTSADASEFTENYEFSSSLPFALGMMYVTEGSVLGGRVILKNVNKALESNADAVEFFSGYGENTSAYWKEFLMVLGQWEARATEEEKEEMIRGAVRGFELAASIVGAGSVATV